MLKPLLVLSALLLVVSAWVETPGGNGAGGLLPVSSSTQLQAATNSIWSKGRLGDKNADSTSITIPLRC